MLLRHLRSNSRKESYTANLSERNDFVEYNMKKTDQSKKNICIAKIERSYIPPFDFPFTSIFNGKNTNFPQRILDKLEFEKGEELICSTVINDKIWTLLTTRNIFSLEGVGMEKHTIDGINKWNWGDFKGYAKQPYTKGFLLFDDEKVVPVFIETGRASMIMIYGIMTISKIST